ncbi:phosphoglycerate kinase [Alkalibacter mobilis]|uniref:phosphoglycerate kinase n=1 Tax=Alkalibacter mobilis TaxID=2787712 RepID=UPI00189D2E14|nr:phosphoglycerate kinase [Alkalibacter mobilis]MBF7097300.1 phosphoglycerate kinase [Alkalibacter mobilis]
MNINSLGTFNYENKRVLLRLDINSPIDSDTKKIVNENRIDKCIPTLKYLVESNAKIAIIAHQGDTLDYQNLISMEEHACKLTEKLGLEVEYIDDVCGPAAIEKIRKLKNGQVILLGNLRYLTEEVSTFEDSVKLEAKEMLHTYIIRNLAPLFDYYVNEAFSAAHRNAPSMVAFQEFMPSAAGDLFFKEIDALNKVMDHPIRPCVFILGGAKISDAFGMMKQVLENGNADQILTCGVTGQVMLLAAGYDIGKSNIQFLKDRSLDVFVKPAQEYLGNYPGRILYPSDLAYDSEGFRKEISVENLPLELGTLDIGRETIKKYCEVINKAGMLFMNGPAGVYEDPRFEDGTKAIAHAMAMAKGYSVIGGGDTVTAVAKYVELDKVDYVCTAGGAMVRYLSGNKLPLMEAMERNSGK